MADNALIVSCPRCGTKNRIPGNRSGDKAICGKCRTPLAQPPLNHPVEVTDQSFQKDVLSAPGVVLLDCWAPWCGPCRMVAPVMEQLAREYAGRAKVAKLNTDENQRTAGRFSIQSIPTLLFFKEGKLVDRIVGALPKREIEGRLKAIL